MRILIIEDEQIIAENIKEYLNSYHYIVEDVRTGEEGQYLAEVENFDLIILDWMLPDIEGIKVCQNIRSLNKTPILMLTAKGSFEDKVSGLDSGADDYLTKPFNLSELGARVRSLLRRKDQDLSPAVITLGDLVVDTNSCKVMIKNQPINLTPREYALLEYLIKNQGKTLTRLELMEHVWGESIDPISNTVDVHINYLRKKVGKPLFKHLIITVKGKGYMLCLN